MKANKRTLALLAAILGCLLLVGTVLAQTSPHYGLAWSVIGGGGGSSQSAHFAVSGTSGQQLAAVSASPNYRVGTGFWYGFGGVNFPQWKRYLPVVMKR